MEWKYLLVIVSALMGACSQMLLKHSARQAHNAWWREYVNVWVISGYALLALSLVVNLYALHLGVLAQEMSIMESINYLFVPLLAWWCFGERITCRKAVAIAVIVAGVVVFFMANNIENVLNL